MLILYTCQWRLPNFVVGRRGHDPRLRGHDPRRRGHDPRRSGHDPRRRGHDPHTSFWKLAYKAELRYRLLSTNIPYDVLVCNNMECTAHCDAINAYHDDIINACIAAAQRCIHL